MSTIATLYMHTSAVHHNNSHNNTQSTTAASHNNSSRANKYNLRDSNLYGYPETIGKYLRVSPGKEEEHLNLRHK